MLLAGEQHPVGLSVSTVLPDLDFETYSEAGMVLTIDKGKYKWISVEGKGKRKGIQAVGSAVYAMHPSTEILTLAYDLKDGAGPRLWSAGDPDPEELFQHIAEGKLLEAFNSAFEYYIWNYVGTRKLGWPELPLNQLRCAMVKARSFSFPGSLGDVASVVGAELKDKKKGSRVIKRFCIPRDPTKTDTRFRILPAGDAEGSDLGEYCVQDIRAEASVSAACPDLSQEELELWLIDQEINTRGIAIDTVTAGYLAKIYDEGLYDADQYMWELTGGVVDRCSEVDKIRSFCASQSIHLDKLNKEILEATLSRTDLPQVVRDVLELRQSTATAGAKKLYAIRNRTSEDGRMRDVMRFYRAITGRWSSEGLQLQNMKAGGPDMVQATCCGAWFPAGLHSHCPWCTLGDPLPEEKAEWGIEPMTFFLEHVAPLGNYEQVKAFYGNYVMAMIASSIRGIVIAGPGKELICSDYSAIEAVVLAVLAGCQWRTELFATHGKIYEKTASDITGIPFEDILAYKKQTGSSHPARKPFGKVPELASGYQGWLGAWKAFGADQFMDDKKIKESILAWRAASPEIVELWGGQYRETRPGSWEFEWDLHGCEGTAIKACLAPGEWHTYRWLRYGVFGGDLYCLLPSGRTLCYHEVQLEQTEDRRARKPAYRITHMFFNTNRDKGPYGWIRTSTYGGKLVENATQAVARDLLAHGIKNVERAGYPVVFHVHDEIVAEVPEGFGSIEEFESLMQDLPAWAEGWPIKAAGGWRGQRYRKD